MKGCEFQVLPSRLPGVDAVSACSRRVFARHWHDQFGVGLVDRGAQKSMSGRGPVEAGPGDVICCNPGEVHDGAPIGETPRAWRMMYLEPRLVADLALNFGARSVRGFEFDAPVTRNGRLARLADRLFAVLTGEDQGDYRMASEQLLLDLLRAMSGGRIQSGGGAPASIAIVKQRIDDDPAALVTLDDLSSAVGLSRFQLLRGFRRATGLTPHAYLVQRRACKARRLIAARTPLAEAACSSGFSDQSHMSRTFKRIFGYTPGVYAAAFS